MFFFTTTDNIRGSNNAANRAEDLIEQAHKIAPVISTRELAELIETDESYILVDTRTESEFNNGHLQNALWIPRGLLEFAVRDGELGNDQSHIILYCRSGDRTSLAVKGMLDLGFTNVKHLKGGFEAWFEEGFSFYNSHGEIKGVSFEKEEQGE